MIIPIEIKKYILKRVDNKHIGDSIPKRNDIKILIKCDCGNIKKSNAYTFLERHSIKCNSCTQKDLECDYSYRKTKEYRLNMKKSMQKSQAWKDTQHLRNTGLKKYWENIRGYKFEDIKDEWYKYRRCVYNLSEQIYKKCKNEINPNNLERGRNKYHLDHKFSVLEGFKNKIPVEIISHQFNLQMLSAYDNLSKDCKCDITKDELFGGAGYLKD